MEESLFKKANAVQTKSKNEEGSESKEAKKPIFPVTKDSSSTSLIQGNKKIQSSNNSPKNLSLVFKKNLDKPEKASSKKEFINKSNILLNNNLEFIKIEDSKPKQIINLKLNLNSLNSGKGNSIINSKKNLWSKLKRIITALITYSIRLTVV